MNFLYDVMKANWLNDTYKLHRQNVLAEREKAFMPATQESVVGYRHYKALRGLNAENELTIARLYNEIAEQRRLIQTRQQEIDRLAQNRYLPRQNDEGDDAMNGGVGSSSTQWVMQCPAPDCHGFLNQAYICGVCEKKTCSRCHALRDASGHQCDADAVASVAMIKKDSKHCPNPSCGAWIHKTMGCSQMFCTVCRTVFDWKTLEIQHDGVFHNPHFFDYLRASGRVPRQHGDVPPCDTLPSFDELEYGFRLRGLVCAQNVYGAGRTPLASCQRAAGHAVAANPHDKNRCRDLRNKFRHLLGKARFARYTTLHGLRPPNQTEFDKNWQLRFQMLINAIDEKEYKRLLGLRERKEQRDRDLYLVVEAYCLGCADIFNGYIYGDTFDGDIRSMAMNATHCPSAAEAFELAEGVLSQLRDLESYSSEQALKVCRRYGIKQKYIGSGVINW